MMMTKSNSFEKRCWSGLPIDILSLIESFLFGVHRCYFRAVCKTWRSAPSPPLSFSLSPPHYHVTYMKEFSILHSQYLTKIIALPTLVYVGRDSSLLNFFNPILNSSYSIQIPELVGTKIRYSKDGWLLMSKGNYEMFFFNPYTRQRIDLPKSDLANDFHGISFSSIPTSSDCVVLGIKVYEDSVSLNFIRHRQTEWKFSMFDIDKEFVRPTSNPVFHSGFFYFLGKTGNFGIYDPEKGEQEDAWRIHDVPKKPCTSIKKCYLAECDGELASVFVGQLGKYVRVYKLDRSAMAWREIKSLSNNKMLFVSHAASLSSTSTNIPIPGAENKVYFPQFNAENGLFYSLQSRKFHTTFGTGFVNENFYDTKEYLQCAWIEPNFQTHSEEELNWFFASNQF